MAGAKPNDTMSARLSNSLPNSLAVLVSRATRPSSPSSNIAAKIAQAACAEVAVDRGHDRIEAREQPARRDEIREQIDPFATRIDVPAIHCGSSSLEPRGPMYPTHAPLNTARGNCPRPIAALLYRGHPCRNCSLHCSTAGIHARVVVIGVAGKHNRERA